MSDLRLLAIYHTSPEFSIGNQEDVDPHPSPWGNRRNLTILGVKESKFIGSKPFHISFGQDS